MAADPLTIAFWIGFIASIVGIVLSIVAIVFSVLVDRRSSKISDHTIQSLQKIESSVERVSSDTRELIKAGWDKMLLGSVDKVIPSAASETSAKELAAGIATELRAELAEFSSLKGSPNKPGVTVEELQEYLDTFESSISALLQAQQMDRRPSVKVQKVIEKVRRLPLPALALVRAIRNRHLTREQYTKLLSGRYSSLIGDLRRVGLLVPVVGVENGEKKLCYYFPTGVGSIIRAIVDDLPNPPEAIQQDIERELKSVAYVVSRNGPLNSAGS